MNAGSVQAAPAAANSLPGKSAIRGAKNGSAFGTVLAGMTASPSKPDMPGSQTKADQTGADLLGAVNTEALADSISDMNGKPAEEILAGLGGLDSMSGLAEWADTLGIDLQGVFEVIGPLLEEAGVTKEQMEEIVFSNDIWPLITAAAEHAEQLSDKIGEMLAGKDSAAAGKQLLQTLALLKTLGTVLPSRDLIGWQQEGVAALNKLVSSLVSEHGNSEVENPANSFAVLSNSHAGNRALDQLGRLQAEQQKPNMHPLAAVLQSGDKETNSEAKSEQNQSTLLHNSTAQPIVSKNVFSLESLVQKPASQAEALLAKLQGLFKQTNFGQLGGTNRLLVKLYPEHLGQVRIELLQVNGVMTARILASTALGKEMLDSQLHQLRQALSQQNVQVDRIDVTQAVQDPSRNDRSQQFTQQHFKGEQEQPEQQETEHEEQQSFQELLIDLEG